MIEKVYCINIIACFLIGMVLLLIKTTPALKDRHYRAAKIYLGVASIIVALGNAVILMNGVTDHPVDIFSLPVLVVSQLQACLFTFASLTLFHSPYVRKRNILCHLAPTFLFVGLYIGVTLFSPDVAVRSFAAFLDKKSNPALLLRALFAVVYLAQIVQYIAIYRRERSRYLNQIDNYFSDTDHYQQRWISRLFYDACSVGVIVLLFSCFPTVEFDFVLTIVITLFYFAFAIRFINYQYWLYYTLPAVSNDHAEEPQSKEESHPVLIDQEIEEQLAAQTLYLQQGITLTDYADAMHISPRRLSAHINTTYGETFKRWINRRRVDYAQTLIEQNSSLNMEEIAERSGFANKGHFSKAFKEHTGKSYTEHRKG